MLEQKFRNGISYVVQGDGDPVILIHGMAASLYDWEALGPDLATAGYRAFALDLPGHGDSAKPDDPDYYHSNAIYELLNDWIDSLSLKRPPILVGHSLGGYFSLQYALHRPHDLRGMVLIDPFYSPQQISPILRHFNRRPDLSSKFLSRIPEWMINVVMGLDPTNANRFSENARRQIADDYVRASPRIMHIPATIVDLTPKLSQIGTDTLVIWGKKDLTLATSSFPQLVSALPKARGQALPGCGHQPHIGNPELIRRLIVKFFARLPVDAAPS